MKETNEKISFFERYLSIWVLLCMAAGILIARFMPSVQSFLQSLEFKGQNIILTWFVQPCRCLLAILKGT